VILGVPHLPDVATVSDTLLPHDHFLCGPFCLWHAPAGQAKPRAPRRDGRSRKWQCPERPGQPVHQTKGMTPRGSARTFGRWLERFLSQRLGSSCKPPGVGDRNRRADPLGGRIERVATLLIRPPCTSPRQTKRFIRRLRDRGATTVCSPPTLSTLRRRVISSNPCWYVNMLSSPKSKHDLRQLTLLAGHRQMLL
jgi:hypothetical protein